jgi:hypothetical protein
MNIMPLEATPKLFFLIFYNPESNKNDIGTAEYKIL